MDSLFLLPTIHQSPEGLLSTSIASVFCESTSPVPSQITSVSAPRPLNDLPRSAERRGAMKIYAQPILRIAILKFFHVQRYLPPCMFFMTALSSSKRALAFSAM